jgi:hypothetical protein
MWKCTAKVCYLLITIFNFFTEDFRLVHLIMFNSFFPEVFETRIRLLVRYSTPVPVLVLLTFESPQVSFFVRYGEREMFKEQYVDFVRSHVLRCYISFFSSRNPVTGVLLMGASCYSTSS